MDNDDLDYDAEYTKYQDKYMGRCFTCGDHVPCRELIKVDYNGKRWWLCECCHMAFWHGGYSPIQIGKELEETERKRSLSEGELKDEKRKMVRKPISLEEIADFMYWLYRDDSKIIDKLS